MTAELFDLPEQARKIRDREGTHLEKVAREAAERLGSPSSALTAVGEILSVRQRYMGHVGEHFSVQAHEGIQVVDHLDEHLARAIQGLLRGYLKSSSLEPSEKSREFLRKRMQSHDESLPQFPVAYAVLYVLRAMFHTFEEMIDGSDESPSSDLEIAFLQRLLDTLDKYLQTRDRPLQRHFSDVEREYSVVNRMKCGCGEEKFRVSLQSLQTTGDGKPYDRLEIQCGSCGARRTVHFELPHFKDLYQL